MDNVEVGITVFMIGMLLTFLFESIDNGAPVVVAFIVTIFIGLVFFGAIIIMKSKNK